MLVVYISDGDVDDRIDGLIANSFVGGNVGLSLGTLLGISVGNTVGFIVGDNVSSTAVGECVRGDSVGSTDGNPVGI